MLIVENLVCGYHAGKFCLSDINLRVNKGELVGIIGPNGSGKSTLLKALSRLLPYSRGRISLAGQELTGYSHQQLAKNIAVVSQQKDTPPSGFTVSEYVLLGRLPYRQRWQFWESDHDRKIAEDAMRSADVLGLKDREITQLSGGEWQRTVIARALAQQPELLLLDEPTTYLDIGHQKEIMELVRNLNRSGITVIIVVHDLNLASIYCDQLVLLTAGKVGAVGKVETIITEQKINSVYDTSVTVTENPINNKPLVCLVEGE